jgi:hypothetical protein
MSLSIRSIIRVAFGTAAEAKGAVASILPTTKAGSRTKPTVDPGVDPEPSATVSDVASG